MTGRQARTLRVRQSKPERFPSCCRANGSRECGAQRDADSHFTPPLSHGLRHKAVDPHDGKQQRERGKRGQERGLESLRSERLCAEVLNGVNGGDGKEGIDFSAEL